MALESRRSYGWSMKAGRLNKDEQKKWEVAYRTDSGSFGICGYAGLFAKHEDAEKFGEKFKAENSWCTEIIIRHPSACYSNY